MRQIGYVDSGQYICKWRLGYAKDHLQPYGSISNHLDEYSTMCRRDLARI